jgi:hypothetical protein
VIYVWIKHLEKIHVVFERHLTSMNILLEKEKEFYGYSLRVGRNLCLFYKCKIFPNLKE